jgi:hypothetical protein
MTPFLMMYRLHPDPDKAGEFLEWLSHTDLLVKLETSLPMAAAVLALEERHGPGAGAEFAASRLTPEAAGWRQKYPDMFKVAEVLRDHTVDKKRPGWNDYHGVRFGILGKREDAKALSDATKHNNPRGDTAHWLISEFLRKFDPDGAFKAIMTELGWFKEFAASRLTIKSLGVTPLGRLLVLLGTMAGFAGWSRLAIYLILAIGGPWLWDYHFYGVRPLTPTPFFSHLWHLPWYFFLIWFVGVLGIKNEPPYKEPIQ